MRKSLRFLALIPTIAVLGIANQVGAQPFANGLARADANQDGMISQAEAASARAGMFDRLDRNSDGQVSGDELENARARISAMSRLIDAAIVLRTQRMDSDGDGILTRDEFLARNPMFEMADLNNDGFVSQPEISAMRDRFTQRN